MTSTSVPTKAGHESTATDEAYNAILDLILGHKLRAGERTSVNLLAARLGMGKTPIKEAIIRLRTEGVLTVSGRSGTTINEIDGAQAMELFAARHMLEDYIADISAANVTAGQIEKINQILKTMKRLSSNRSSHLSAEFVRANTAFHSLIVSASGNRTISRLYEQLQIQSQIMTYLLYQTDPAAAASRRQQEHEEIAEALATRNGALLKKLLRRHTKDSERIILERLRDERVRPARRRATS